MIGNEMVRWIACLVRSGEAMVVARLKIGNGYHAAYGGDLVSSSDVDVLSIGRRIVDHRSVGTVGTVQMMPRRPVTSDLDVVESVDWSLGV